MHAVYSSVPNTDLPLQAEKLVFVVFAGGPHTRSRLYRAAELSPVLKPVTVIFTGTEFLEIPHDLLVQASGGAPFKIERSSTTLESCVRLSAAVRRGELNASTIVAITSNYHRPRVWWLLHTALSSTIRIRVEATSDMTWRDPFRSRVARRLALGEVISWSYCIPAGIGLWLKR